MTQLEYYSHLGYYLLVGASSIGLIAALGFAGYLVVVWQDWFHD